MPLSQPIRATLLAQRVHFCVSDWSTNHVPVSQPIGDMTRSQRVFPTASLIG